MSDDMSAYIDVFVSESADFLVRITDALLALERTPEDLEPVEEVFRGAHSLKGMAGAMAYERSQELAHGLESLMDTVRQRAQVADHSLIDLALQATDGLRDLIADEVAGTATVDTSAVLAALASRTARADTGDRTPGRLEDPIARGAALGDIADGPLYRVTVTLTEGAVLKGVRAYMTLKRLGHIGTVSTTVPDPQALEDERFDHTFEVLFRTRAKPDDVRMAVLGVTDVADAVVEEVTTTAESAEAGDEPVVLPRRRVQSLADTQTVRLSVTHLDTLVNLVGEIVIMRSRLERIARSIGNDELTEALETLGGVTAELQHEVLQTRMVPVGHIFNRFARMMRDLGRELDKDAIFVTEGTDIELDRIVLDEIGDPIVHVLRNALDHGIELPQERLAAGKPPRGTVRLSAEREREQVRITVTDDGRGMDPERIWAKAVERGLVSASSRDQFPEAEVLALVCTPGFSTADEATRVSGRGVGMDAAKGKIEYLGGTLAITSEQGVGTTITLMLPLTLAIIPALLLGCGEQVYALPLSAVDEVLDADEVTVKTIDGRPVIVLRSGEVVSLDHLEAVCAGADSYAQEPARGDHIVIIHTTGATHALGVSKIVDRQEIVVKPLSPLFKGVRGFSGATVLGDGRVALIVDPRTLFTKEV